MYLFAKLLFHFSKADYIQPLKDMSAVRWVPKDNNIVIPCIFKELQSIMGAVSIHQNHVSMLMSTIVCIFPCFCTLLHICYILYVFMIFDIFYYALCFLMPFSP